MEARGGRGESARGEDDRREGERRRRFGGVGRGARERERERDSRRDRSPRRGKREGRRITEGKGDEVDPRRGMEREWRRVRDGWVGGREGEDPGFHGQRLAAGHDASIMPSHSCCPLP